MESISIYLTSSPRDLAKEPNTLCGSRYLTTSLVQRKARSGQVGKLALNFDDHKS